MKPILVLLLSLLAASAYGQGRNSVYIDKKGTMRFTSNKKEALFFGVNYTVPFAYGYRSHLKLGVDLEEAIDADVYHMKRLGLNAFRVHVWDVEISDSLGNLLDNEHLRLFDYLLSRLKDAGIYTVVTPIAFWGNGYPERDEKTPGFSTVYGKGPSVVKEEAIRAQENYLKQFFNHVNPYTKLRYGTDTSIIAAEINNEPHHSGPPSRTTEYINRLAAAIRGTGWTKPVFYNISESPSYARAVAAAKVDGHSFQWYPTGLVKGHELRGNYLPHVDQYRIPFTDSLPVVGKRAKMVYEFDAGDVLQPIMYPAMARSFRRTGFQWATQFAYDPMYTAYANTEYQTHYLNLAYTPAKAISLMIAAEVFRSMPSNLDVGSYPGDTVFGNTLTSYTYQLSEWNSDEKFYYSGNTATRPKNSAKLKHLAGIGSSPLVTYEGTGAYFLDRNTDGSWMLELMPDAVQLSDPFEKASPNKTVTAIHWEEHSMIVNLPGLEEGFFVVPSNTNNTFRPEPEGMRVILRPGKYLFVKRQQGLLRYMSGNDRFFAPSSTVFTTPQVYPQLPAQVEEGNAWKLGAVIAGFEEGTAVAELRNSNNGWKTVQLQKEGPLFYAATIPADFTTSGQIEIRIFTSGAKDSFSFPGAYRGDPYVWDAWHNESWTVPVATATSPLSIFDAASNRGKLIVYNSDWRANSITYPSGETENLLLLKASMKTPRPGAMMAMQYFFADDLAPRKERLAGANEVRLRVRASAPATIDFSLIDAAGASFSTQSVVDTVWKELILPLKNFSPDSILLLPRPYPGFQPLWFRSSTVSTPDASKLESWQLRFIAPQKENFSLEISSITLH